MNQDNKNFLSAAPPDSGMYRSRHLKLLVLLCGIGLLAIAIGIPLYRYFADGRIVIHTNNPQNIISLLRSPVHGSNVTDKAYTAPVVLKNGQPASVAPGTYTASVSGNGASVSQVVNVKAGRTASYTIDLASLGTIETVADSSSQSFSVSNSQLVYLDQNSQNLYQLNSQNILSRVDGSTALTKLRWIDPTFGIGQDAKGSFYYIDNGSLNSFTAPVSGSQVVFAIAPNHTVYLANGQGVYAGQPTNGFKKIYTLTQAPLAMAASNQGLALIYNPGEGPIKGGAEKVVLLNNNGSLKVQKPLGALNGWWSPSGKYLLLVNDSSAQIFNSSLNPVALVPSSFINSPVWLSDSSLLYGINNQLWEYQISSGRSQELAVAAPNHAIENIVLNQDSSYAYLSVQSTASSSNDLIIERLGLRNQAVSSLTYTLQSNLPWLSGRCLMYFTNFTAPTVQYYDDHPEDNCDQVAKSYVSQLGIDPSKLQYNPTNVPPDEPAS